MSRAVPFSGLLAVVSGAAWLVPAIAASGGRGHLELHDYAVCLFGPLLILCGAGVVIRSFRDLRLAAMPSAVRVAIAGNGLFAAFCALEFSDGFLRQNGRVFYWTSILFLPVLALFYGQVFGQRWAWWGARIVTAIFSVWFAGFLMMIPFAHLRGNGGAAPWWGKIYAECVTLLFVSSSVWVFRSLGCAEARKFYGTSNSPHRRDKGGMIQSAKPNSGGL